MYGSVAIVTGGNSGLGKAVAQHLLFQNAEVVLACRNMTACELARAELTLDFQSEFPDKPCKCRCEYLDVEDHESIRAFSKSMVSKHAGNIKLLVNNAGAPSFPPVFYLVNLAFTSSIVESSFGVQFSSRMQSRVRLHRIDMNIISAYSIRMRFV